MEATIDQQAQTTSALNGAQLTTSSPQRRRRPFKVLSVINALAKRLEIPQRRDSSSCYLDAKGRWHHRVAEKYITSLGLMHELRIIEDFQYDD